MLFLQTMLQRQIIHIDLDSFFVSVECRKDNSLLGKPVAIGDSGERGVIASCSYEARKFGVHAAMPGKLAQKLCPHLIFVKGDYQSYTKASREVTEIIADQVPLFEKSSIDEFYIDMTGLEKYFGTLKLGVELRQKIINETGLPISFGLSANKTVSKIATGLAKPSNYLEVPTGNEKAFLAPLVVGKIPMVGEKAVLKLNQMGVFTISQLQQTPLKLLQHTFGKQGIMMFEKANGICNSPVIAYTERKSISSETTFEKDTCDIKFLEATLISITETLSAKIRQKGFFTSSITLKIRYGNFSTYTHQVTLNPTANETLLIAQVKNVFKNIYNLKTPVRLIGVKFSNLKQGHYQLNIFDDNLAQKQLYQTLDKLNLRFGNKTICRAISLGVH